MMKEECYFCGDEEADFILDDYGKMYEGEFACFSCTEELERTLQRTTE